MDGVHGMPSESPTCVRTGGDSADAGIEYISPEGLFFKPTKAFIGIGNLGRKSTNLAKPVLCLRSCLHSSRAFRPEPRGEAVRAAVLAVALPYPFGL
jgi:hypothetical protein